MPDAPPHALEPDVKTLKLRIKHALRRLGVNVNFRRTPQREVFEGARETLRYYARLASGLEKDFLRLMLENLFATQAQIHQDAFILALYGEKRDGFFCEFGAADGLHLSNTWLLETRYGWRGILGEPGRTWHEALRRNRPGAALETRCVWARGGETLAFHEADDGEFSTLESFVAADRHASRRRGGTAYQVPTVTLTEMLAAHDAPPVIDYLSIDTEGSEFDILGAHDFDRFRIGAITVEHNYAPVREKIHALLTERGYDRVLVDWSQWDDWYVHPEVLRRSGAASAA